MTDEIALSLLKKYTERYYTFRKREIVSNTPAHQMQTQWGLAKTEIEARNIVFQEDRDSYIGSMLRGLLPENAEETQC